MTDTTLPGVFLKGLASARPAANAVAGGTVYSATDTGVISQSDGVSTWTTWATIASGMTNPMSAIGDIIQGTTAGAPARLAAPLAGKVLTGAGVTTPVAYAYPPGYEMAYVEFTSVVTVTAGTVEATAISCVSAGSVAFDGSTIVMIEFYAPNYQNPNATDNLRFWLYDGASSIGEIGRTTNPAAAAAAEGGPVVLKRRMTPSNASHTYSIAASATNTASVSAGAGGASTYMPGFIRITKV